MVCFFFLPRTFLYILINMSPFFFFFFWYDRYFYWRPVRGVFTRRGRVKEATSEILYTNRRVWSEPARVFLHRRRWWDGHTSMVMPSSKSDQHTRAAVRSGDVQLGPWSLHPVWCCCRQALSPSFFFTSPPLPHFFNNKRKITNITQRGATMGSQNAHQNTSGSVSASY